ncbi:NAD-dependent epimerase/dehydratase [Xylanimonas cellulosilytica DSM 15894]|uniref:NAD-dependent epimerase/dehydratase n=1 Tax=Xylanimonas cellulosilytica (strain DSM 15894 / JCM 12276 / CECT 5975 / KCTC 9989 / LMG 20990 / NBRC 107835 / XIL07) TaxID=446471 RepID=D1BVD3_XYLCX|nr:NAD-dependent epimerase/dehydratase family protein [Xylanimonas cellulosilytica]ACZ29404.1 NAD-dependent epimerase/dehydratase [Xylanimonas cellulosilytica DSM 15894]
MTSRNPKSVLFIGGSGVISHASVARAVEQGHRVTLLNRGLSSQRPLPDTVETLVADATDHDAVDAALAGRDFDVVAQFRAFHPDHVARDVARFTGRTGQYVFISSASAYQKPPARLPVTESTPLVNPFWQYSRDKIACEDLLVRELRDNGFPSTIVRPSHTYDRTLIPTLGGWTDVARMRAGKPVVVHGDGTTQWTLTHTNDFAVGFVGLLGNPRAVGDTFQIMGTHAPTWNQIYTWLAAAAGVPEPELVHVASETIARVLPEDGPGLLGDKAHSMVFDCSKLQALVPEFATTITYDEAAAEQIAWHDATASAQQVDAARDKAFDDLVDHARG